MRTINRSDLIAGLGITVVAVCVHLSAGAMPAARRGLGPGGYPAFVAAGLLVLGLLLTVSAFLRPAAAGAADSTAAAPAASSPLRRILVFSFLVLAYALALRPLGFFLASAVFLFAAAAFFGYKKRLPAAVFSVLLAAAVYIVFRHVFLVLLPTGSLFQ